MPKTVSTTVLATFAAGFEPGSIVRCGPAGAVWRVIERSGDADVTLTLEPVDPHDVPLDVVVRELPMPFRQRA